MKNAHLVTLALLLTRHAYVYALYIPWEDLPSLSEDENGRDRLYGNTPDYESSDRYEHYTPEEWDTYPAENAPAPSGDSTSSRLHEVSHSSPFIAPSFTLTGFSVPGLDLSTTITHGPDFKLETAHVSLWLATPSSSSASGGTSSSTSSMPTSSVSSSSTTMTASQPSLSTTSTSNTPTTSSASSSTSSSARSSPGSIEPTSSVMPNSSSASSTSSAFPSPSKSGNASVRNLAPVAEGALRSLSSVLGAVAIVMLLIL